MSGPLLWLWIHVPDCHEGLVTMMRLVRHMPAPDMRNRPPRGTTSGEAIGHTMRLSVGCSRRQASYRPGVIRVVTPMRFQALIVVMRAMSWASSCSSNCAAARS